MFHNHTHMDSNQSDLSKMCVSRKKSAQLKQKKLTNGQLTSTKFVESKIWHKAHQVNK